MASSKAFLLLFFFFFFVVCFCGHKAAAHACPKNALKLGFCSNMLGRPGPVIGAPPTTPCCKFIGGLIDLEAAVCLCTAIKADVLGINLDIPVSLSQVFNNCQKNLPSGFQCQ